MKKFILLILFIYIQACTPFKLSPVDFSWPIESVLRVNNQGFALEERYSMKINVMQLFIDEFGQVNNINDKEIRIIRNASGTYFITASGFKNVYLFKQDESSLLLIKKIFVSEIGLENPYFNQRDNHIELVFGDKKLKLNNNGIIGDKK